MVDARVAVFVSLDLLSLLLSGIVAAFFWRSHRLAPRQSFGVLGSAFAILAVSHLSVALSGFQLFPQRPILDAVRGAGVFLASVLILLAYIFRSRAQEARTLPVLAITFGVGTLLYLAASLLPAATIFSPRTAFPWLRLVDAFILLTAAGYAGVGIHAKRLADLQVPAAFVLLAFSRYTSALLAFLGDYEPSTLTYAWRLLALGLLAAVVWRRWPRAPP